MNETLSFGDIRCDTDGDTLRIRPTVAWTVRMIFFAIVGLAICLGITAACVGGFLSYQEQGDWSMWLCLAGAALFVLLAICSVFGAWALMRMSKPLTFDRLSDSITRGSDSPGKISEVAHIAVEKLNDEDAVVLHFKDAEKKHYDTYFSNMSGGADSRIAKLIARFISVKAIGFQGSILFDPASPGD
jgi:hypothetical protein